jgi:hypothetical protein
MKEEDYYINENGKVVFTEKYHLRRGWCCSSKCLNCPFEPQWTKGSTQVRKLNNDNDDNDCLECP